MTAHDTPNPSHPSRAAELWATEHELVAACRAHPFVRGIASGELPRARFVAYVEQDAWFLTAFARAYALAIAKAPDLRTMTTLRGLLDGALEELDLHRGYAQRWGADLDPEPSPATLAYTDSLLRVAWSEPLPNILAAMTPCMRLYADLGQHLLPEAAPDSPYREWCETYADPGFEELAQSLERLLDQVDDGSTAIAAHYHQAMLLEHAFFDQVA
jgi:thiaminase (transcriptional activator TenA)